jgi:hypothetical protein
MAGYLQGSGSIAMSEINSVFDGRGNNIGAYRGTAWYTAGGSSGTFPSSGSLAFDYFYGKGPNPAFTVAYSSGFGNGYFIDDVFYSPGAPAGAGIRWNTNGTMDQYGYSFGYQSLGQTWGNPTTSGIGSNYWIRFTRTATGGFGAAAASTASTGWLQLTSPGREITIYQDSANQITAEYTVEISSSSSGSPVLTTRTGITIGLSNGYL